MGTSSGTIPEGSGIRYEDILKGMACDICSHLFEVMCEPLLELELKHWTLFTNMEYKAIVFEEMCFNMDLLINMKKPQILGRLLSRRPLRPHLIKIITETQTLRRLREHPDTLDQMEPAFILHKQLIYYPDDFPEGEDEINAYIQFLEKKNQEKYLNEFKNEI